MLNQLDLFNSIMVGPESFNLIHRFELDIVDAPILCVLCTWYFDVVLPGGMSAL